MSSFLLGSPAKYKFRPTRWQCAHGFNNITEAVMEEDVKKPHGKGPLPKKKTMAD
jgi:hypothetical protein